jgi:dinuclear metal center YbgI/SA1388 family protein
MTDRNTLCQYLNQLLSPEKFTDYCPNGLQIEGKNTISKVITGVTASLALIDAAIKAQADALIVHHGFFWKGETAHIDGIKKTRIAKILQHDLNLIAYHLPLDYHPEIGNNTQLAKKMNWVIDREQSQKCAWGLIGHTATPITAIQLANQLQQKLNHPPLCIGDQNQIIHRIAWCTGGAQGYFEEAIKMGVDAFITGEISEKHVHIARETGVQFIAAGHHATEKFGIEALGNQLAQTFAIECTFIDIESPV